MRCGLKQVRNLKTGDFKAIFEGEVAVSAVFRTKCYAGMVENEQT